MIPLRQAGRAIADRARRDRRPTLEALEGRLLLSASDLDPSFGGTGLVTDDFGNGGAAVAVQADGKVVVGGTARATGNNDADGLGLIRYRVDGSLDATFDGDGRVKTNFGTIGSTLNDLALAPDGKIVAVGHTWVSYKKGTKFVTDGAWVVARYNANGSLDTTFGDPVKPNSSTRTGKLTINDVVSTSYEEHEDANAVAVQPDGKIVIVGAAPTSASNGIPRFLVIRLNTDGTLDRSFGTLGKAQVTFPAGSHIVGGTPTGVALDADGRIIVTGQPRGDGSGLGVDEVILVRLDQYGKPDGQFDGDGIVVLRPPSVFSAWIGADVGLQPSGQIVVSGEAFNPNPANFVARFNADGQLDTGFGTQGYYVDSRIAGSNARMAVQGDGSVLVVGTHLAAPGISVADYSVLRLTVDGQADTTFGDNGLSSHAFGAGGESAAAVAIAPDGSIILVGSSVDTVNNRLRSRFATLRLRGSS